MIVAASITIMLAALAGCRSTSEPAALPSTTDTAASASAPAPSTTEAPQTLPDDFVRLADVDPSILQEIRYAGDHNFIGSPIAGYDAPECWLTAPTAAALVQVQEQVRAQGYTVKVYDCYRPQQAVDEFMTWAADPTATEMKDEFYPRVEKTQIIPGGYVATKSGHSRGSTVDVTLVPLPGAVSPTWTIADGLQDCALPADQRFPDTSIDMGSGFDCFDVASHTANPSLDPQQRANRDLLVGAMAAAGFKNLAEEWWHYTLIEEPYPDTFFGMPITSAGPN
jgi:D-alanyl-D-alanine dipeptidase